MRSVLKTEQVPLSFVGAIYLGEITFTFKVKLSPKCNLGFFVNVYESNLRVKAKLRRGTFKIYRILVFPVKVLLKLSSI